MSPRRALAFGVACGLFLTVGIILLVGTPSQQFIYLRF
jgi:hypothetical protein